MDLGVAGQGYLVVGGSAGIGLAAAHTLSVSGAHVAIAGRRAERAAAASATLSEKTGAKVVPLSGDVAEPGVADRLVNDAVAALGGLRGVAVTVGLGMTAQRTLLDASDEDWALAFDDVLLSVARVCRAAVPALIDGGGGAIVTTAAYSIRAPKPHQVPYAALKSGVATLTKTLAKAYGPDGVRANCVCPGATETEVLAQMRTAVAEQRGWPVEEALERVMTEEWGMRVALGRAGTPQEVGDVLAFLVSERASYVTGAVLNVDGGTDF